MIKYIIRDVTAMLRYLPYGLLVGIVMALLLSALNDMRVKQKKVPFSLPATIGFFMYVVIILCITFLSRESGSSSSGMDMKLFSTWGINNRNNAYVIENIILFIPYGFFGAWAIKHVRGGFNCFLLGLVTSLGVECLQLVTGRGFFQLDDILTNTLGTVLGYFLFRIIFRHK